MKKPQPHKYYDIHDILKYFNLGGINDLVEHDLYGCNGCLVDLYWHEDDYGYIDKKDREAVRRFHNLEKVYKVFGNIKVLVWW